jgi:hypothetical protein
MIRALNVWRRGMGAPTVPTITGKRTPSRKAAKRFWQAVRDGCFGHHVAARNHGTMEHWRDLEACPNDMLGEPNAARLGRFVRMAKAVRAGFEAPPRGAP